MTEPRVSVMMITYNHAPYIAQAIEGVLQQRTNFPFELVIGEDCSTDGTRELVFEYQKKHPNIIRVITSDDNVGMKKNGYRTMKACQGKYLAFCEGDDYWHNLDKLQKQADYLDNHPECGLIYSDFDTYYVGSQKRINNFIKYKKWKILNNPNISDFVRGSSGLSLGILSCTVMVRRALSDQIIESDPYLHQSGHFLMGDSQLWAEIIHCSHLYYIDESLSTYTITDESAMRSKDIEKTLRFFISNAELFLYLCDKYHLSSSIREKHEAVWCDLSLRLAFYSRNAKLAAEVRNRKETFTWKDLLRYYGAKYRILNYLFQAAILLNNFNTKEKDQWS